MFVIDLDDLVRVHDDGDEEGEDDVGEHTDEQEQVEPAVDANTQGLICGDGVEGGEDVVPVDESEQALQRGRDGFELEVVRSEDDPAGENEPEIDEGGAEEEAKDARSGTLHGEDEDVVGPEEAQVAEEAEPHEHVACAEE